MTKEALVQEILNRILAMQEQEPQQTEKSCEMIVLDMTSSTMEQIAENSTIYLKNISVDVLAQLALGYATTPQTCFVREQLLQGKTLYTVVDEIELYKYKESAKKAYYGQMNGYVEFLKASGLVVANDCKALQETLKTGVEPTCAHAQVPKQEKTCIFEKRVLTEQAVSRLRMDEGVTALTVGKKTLVTDLAKDYAKNHNIVITRQGGGKL